MEVDTLKEDVMNDMQIDPAVARSMVEPQRTMKGSPAGLRDISAQENGSDFGSVLSNFMNGGAPVSKGTTVTLAPGVTWEDGLLWQQLGAIDDSEGDSSITFRTETSAAEETAHTARQTTDSINRSFEDLIASAGEKYGVPASLIKAVIDTESSFNPYAVSSAGAKGLMQLMDGTARGLGVADSFDPVQNIEGGTKYLSYQLQKFGGEVAMALAAYNAGPSRVSRLGVTSDAELLAKADMLPAETQSYIRKVLTARSKYEV